jgi:hypothetical protein
VHTPPPPSTYDLVPTTTIALAREPACFAFLCAEAEHPPVPIDALQIDIASADHFAGRSSVWATLEIRSAALAAAATGTSALLGFDETFLPLFARAFLRAATTRKEVRLNVVTAPDVARPPCIIEYVSGVDIPVLELVLIPCAQVVLVAADVGNGGGGEETLFQLPRTDSFLRSFARITDAALHTQRFARARRYRWYREAHFAVQPPWAVFFFSHPPNSRLAEGQGSHLSIVLPANPPCEVKCNLHHRRRFSF